ncbi:hypothetical protein [Streptomyces sp. NPDC049813]|uniref:hypothetical protein n=1 Tax=Streptomyces sp. NPDC049813 TaxID=3365597 RepID=UPI00378DAEEB
MEQRMESQKVTPVTGAGFDPAYVPGLTSPEPEAVAEDAVTESDEVGEEVSRDDAPGAVRFTKAAREPEEGADGEEPAGAEPVAAAVEDGPVMAAKDRRGSITVDAAGVRFTLDDQEAEFTWDEISAVEYGTSRKRLTVTVHTPNSRWYPNDVEAADKSRLAEWTGQLDAALDAYFED